MTSKFDSWSSGSLLESMRWPSLVLLSAGVAGWSVASGVSGIRYWAPELVVPAWSGIKGVATPNAAALRE